MTETLLRCTGFAAFAPTPARCMLPMAHAGVHRPTLHDLETKKETPMEETETTTRTVHEQLAPHSVELTVNAKGSIQAAIKVYDDDPSKAAERAVAVLDKLKTQLGNRMAGSETNGK